jgi:hypothetical protein
MRVPVARTPELIVLTHFQLQVRFAFIAHGMRYDLARRIKKSFRSVTFITSWQCIPMIIILRA